MQRVTHTTMDHSLLHFNQQTSFSWVDGDCWEESLSKFALTGSLHVEYQRSSHVLVQRLFVKVFQTQYVSFGVL